MSYTLSQLNSLSNLELNILTFNQNATENNSLLVAAINATLSNLCTSITQDADIFTLNFTQELTQEQINILANTLANYTYVDLSAPIIQYNSCMNISLKTSKFNTSVFSREASFNYEGSLRVGQLAKILVSSYMDTGNTSYTIRIFDKTHNNIIDESTFTNINENFVELNPINNVSEERSNIEILVKKTGGNANNFFYINSITFYFI
jgi:hypothetical protein